MENISKLINYIHLSQIKDWKLKKMSLEESPDWAIKRIEAILREAIRLGITDIKWEQYDNVIEATWKGLPLVGRCTYESRDLRCKSKWMRPRIALHFWVKTKVLSYAGLWERGLITYDGKGGRIFSIGGEALEIVFGKKRMMVYNRLMVAVLNCVGKIK